MRNKIIVLALMTVIANANTNILINNTSKYVIMLTDITTSTTCTIDPNATNNIIVNNDYTLSCKGKSKPTIEDDIVFPLPHKIKITKGNKQIPGCITNLPDQDMLIYITDQSSSLKSKLSCKNFPPL